MGIHDCKECWFVTDDSCNCEVCGCCPLDDPEEKEGDSVD